MYRVPQSEFASPPPAHGRSVQPDKFVLVDSLSAYVSGGMAQRAELRDVERQTALTARFLAPALPVLDALFRDIRAGLDKELRRAQPTRAGKPFPIGQCLEITQAVLHRLDSLDPQGLSAPASEGWAALAAFRAAGGEVRRAWGDLRGQYFQNAMIVGVLYVDCANDSVVVTKPPVEILPFSQADFRPLAGIDHYLRIAERYWGVHALPNHLAPDLAPFFPLILVGPNGALRLGPRDRYMIALNLAENFAQAEGALTASPMPTLAFSSLRAALTCASVELAASPEDGRAAALAGCAHRRGDTPEQAAAAFNRAMLGGRALNSALARLALVRAL